MFLGISDYCSARLCLMWTFDWPRNKRNCFSIIIYRNTQIFSPLSLGWKFLHNEVWSFLFVAFILSSGNQTRIATKFNWLNSLEMNSIDFVIFISFEVHRQTLCSCVASIRIYEIQCMYSIVAFESKFIIQIKGHREENSYGEIKRLISKLSP